MVLLLESIFFRKNLEKGNIWGNNFQKGEFPPQKPQKGNFPRVWGNVAALQFLALFSSYLKSVPNTKSPTKITK